MRNGISGLFSIVGSHKLEIITQNNATEEHIGRRIFACQNRTGITSNLIRKKADIFTVFIPLPIFPFKTHIDNFLTFLRAAKIKNIHGSLKLFIGNGGRENDGSVEVHVLTIIILSILTY